MNFEFSKSKSNFKGKLCCVLAVILVVLCLQPGFTAFAADSEWYASGGNITCGNVTGSNVTGGNVTGGDVYNLELRLNDDCVSYYVSYASDSARNVVIPSTYNGMPVTSIGSHAFAHCYNLTSVSIPDSIKSISEYAFYCCYNLTSITIPDSVTSIGSYAFYYCERLTSVEMGKSVKSIGSYAFKNCYILTSITIPDSVTSIGEEAFYSTLYYNSSSNWENNVLYIGNHLIKASSSLSGDYEIREGTKTIASEAFYRCSKLNSVTIPDSVTSIGSNAFYYCYNLTSVTIPDSVTSIGKDAFYNSGYYNDSINWENDVLYIGNHLIKANSSISCACEIREGTKTIASKAFDWCTRLTSITIPDSVKSISSYAFNYCNDLTAVTIPNSVKSISSYAFAQCSSLTSITIPDSVKSIGAHAFLYCDNLSSITIPGSVTSIGEHAFHGCDNLTSVTILDGVKNIGKFAFYCCSSLKSIAIPDSVTGIGSNAFSECSSIVNVKLPENIKILSGSLFYWCSSLKSILIPDSVQCIDYSAFRGCKNLKSIVIPDSVTDIGTHAFLHCDVLEKVYVPDSVIYIGDDAFVRQTDIYGYANSYTEEYAERYHLNFITVSKYSNNTIYTPITRNKIEYTKYMGYDSEIIIPSKLDEYSVYAVAESAFAGDLNINSVVLPESLVKVGASAFEGCKNLESVIFASGTKTIGSYAFSDCKNLSKVVLPSSIEKLDAYTFKNCLSLTEIIIPESVTEIDLYAFYNCVNLETIYGKTGSYAEEFAEENGYIFIDVSEKIIDIKASSIKIIENANGYYDTDCNGNEFFCYYDDFIYNDIEYTVEYGSGDTKTVGYWELESMLGEEINILTNQRDIPFKLGKNKIKLKVGNLNFFVTFEIIENPIESIEISDISIVEGTNGYFAMGYDEEGNDTEEYYYYDIYDLSFTATLKDGSVVSGKHAICIYDVWYYLDVSTNQAMNHWGVGTHTVTGELFGVSDEFSVIITESPVQSIECKDVSITEYTNGYFTTHSDEYDNKIEYYYYEISVDCEITLKNGTVIKCDENGCYEYNGNNYYIDLIYTQEGDSPWVSGNSYPVTAYAMGASDTYNVKITESNIKSVSVSVVNPFYEGLSVDLYNNDYILKIEYKDGSTEELTYSYAELWTNDIDIFAQEDGMWTLGTHKAEFRYQGFITEFEYTVLECPYEKIEISNDDGLTIYFTQKDGSVVEAIPYGFDFGIGDVCFVSGYLFTNKGVFWTTLYFDTDKCSNFKMKIGEMESNVLEKNNWWKALSFGDYFSFIVYAACPTLNNYNGNITSQNIDDVVESCYLYLEIPGEWDDSIGYTILDGDDVRDGIAEIYGIENVDLSLSDMYDSETDTFKVSNSGFGGGSSKNEIHYSNNTWMYIHTLVWTDVPVELKIEMDEYLKVKSIDLGNVFFDVVDNKKTIVDDEKDIILTESSHIEELDSLLLLDEGISTKIEYSYDYPPSQIIGTGSIVEFYDEAGNLVDRYTVVIVGDLNGDGVCDVLDASVCALYANEMKAPTVIQAYAANGEVNNIIDIDAYQNVVNLSVS